jgi:hypothetical protein
VNGKIFHRGDRELRGTPAQTKVTFRGADDEHGLEVYMSEHEMLKRVEGRLYSGEEFHEFFKKNQVLLVLNRKEALLACKASGTVAKDFVDDWNEISGRFRAEYINFDLEKLRSHIDEVRGIWRSGLNQPNVDTFAVFGSDVDQSPLYSELCELGYTASILVSQQVGETQVPVIISARGTVTFPQPAAEEEQIDRLLGLVDRLLKHGLVVVDSRKTAKEKREQERTRAKTIRVS